MVLSSAITVWLVEIGFVSILGQVVLLRELNVAFFGSELIYILALSVWLLCTAWGAMLGRKNAAAPIPAIRWLLFVLASLFLLDLIFIRAIHLLFGGTPGGYLPFPKQLVAMALSLLPVGLCLGWLFRVVARYYVQEGKTLARAYAVECIGGLIGGAIATGALSANLSNLTSALICASSALGAAVYRLNREALKSFSTRAVALLSAFCLALLFAAFCLAGPIDRALTAWSHPRLLETVDTPYGRSTVIGQKGQISLFQNNALVSESQGTSAEEFVHLSALQHGAPRSFLILGGGIEGLIREAQKHKPREINAIELDRRAWNLAIRHLPSSYLQLPGAKAARIRFTDPRGYLNRSRQKADVILLGMPEPDSAQMNRFYTKEFFRQAANHLSSQGIFAFRLRYAENLWTSHLLRRASSIHRALERAFSEITVLPGTYAIFIASKKPLTRDPTLLERRLSERHIETRMVSPAYLRYLYTNDRYFEIKTRLEKSVEPPNSDARPICYQHTLVIWLSRFFPALALMDLSGIDALNRAPLTTGLYLFIGLSLIFLLIRRLPAARRVLLAFIAGFIGMLAESVLIMNYQARSGVLYQDLGLLLTLFMAGLALGAAAFDRLRRKRWIQPRLAVWLGFAILLAFVSLSLYNVWLLTWQVEKPLFYNGAGLFVSGALVAALFAYASPHALSEQRRLLPSLYAADLLGGCLGSAASSLLLLPILGLINTTLLTIALALAALFLLNGPRATRV
ncbi:MAG: hypothetical protein JXA30_06160 [Deltaproteobacteria bacterium]|nr:hypothetical protein [Deltaproteobacteria bacterium]